MEIVNIQTLENLREFMSPEELNNLLEKVLVEVHRSSESLNLHFDVKDWPALRADVHRLKGSLGSVGCDAIYFELNKLELQLSLDAIAEPSEHEIFELKQLLMKTSESLLITIKSSIS